MATELQLRCACDDCEHVGALRHQNTAYRDEESNWAVLCLFHQKEADEYWEERWSEYYAGCL